MVIHKTMGSRELCPQQGFDGIGFLPSGAAGLGLAAKFRSRDHVWNTHGRTVKLTAAHHDCIQVGASPPGRHPDRESTCTGPLSPWFRTDRKRSAAHARSNRVAYF